MINYVIATWSGPRRYDIPEAVADRGFYLKEHFKALQTWRMPKVTRITVALVENDAEPPEFTEAWHSLPGRVQGADVAKFYRRNAGLSYGSWSDAFGIWGDAFPYYFFMEDDFQPCMHDWDSAMLSMMTPGVGYLAGLIRPGQLPRHAGNANGLLDSRALTAVRARYGMLPHHTFDADYGAAEAQGQVGLSRAVMEAGWELRSVTEEYSSHFKHGACLDSDKGAGPLIMRPIGNYPL